LTVVFQLRGLDPSLFTLLLDTLPIGDSWLLSYFGELHFTLLTSTIQFTEVHDLFYSNSSILTSSSASNQPGKMQFVSEGPTAKYFEGILKVLAQKLVPSLNEMGERQRRLVMKWLEAVVECVSKATSKSLLLAHPLVMSLRRQLLRLFIDSALHGEAYKGLMNSIGGLNVFSLLTPTVDNCEGEEFVREISERLLVKVGCMSEEEFQRVWAELPPVFLFK